jgi:hypothetical protein
MPQEGKLWAHSGTRGTTITPHGRWSKIRRSERDRRGHAKDSTGAVEPLVWHSRTLRPYSKPRGRAQNVSSRTNLQPMCQHARARVTGAQLQKLGASKRFEIPGSTRGCRYNLGRWKGSYSAAPTQTLATAMALDILKHSMAALLVLQQKEHVNEEMCSEHSMSPGRMPGARALHRLAPPSRSPCYGVVEEVGEELKIWLKYQRGLKR